MFSIYSNYEKYNEAFYRSKLLNFYFEDLQIGVIDIETTGLNPESSHFILGGLVLPDGNEKKAIQLMAENKAEESDLLNGYLKEINNLDVLISYNGNNFDIPFLLKRLRKNKLDYSSFFLPQSLDLYRVLNRCSSMRQLLPNLKQKTVENFLGLWKERSDEISGAESVELYNEYLRSGESSLRDLILLHNRDDILQLSRMLKVFEKLDLHEIMFRNGFAVSYENKKVYIKEIVFQKQILWIKGTTKNLEIDYNCFKTSHQSVFSVSEGTFDLKINLDFTKGSYFIDLNEFGFDFSEFQKYPGFQSDFLILKTGSEINYAETNHLIKFVLKEILKEM